MGARAVFCLREPTEEELDELIAGCRDLELSYRPRHLLRAPAPPGYAVDRNRIELGAGDEVFDKGVAAMRRWTMFELGWVRPGRRDYPIEEGQVVAVIARTLGLRTVNFCRILEVFDEQGPEGRRFGFTYGTLPVHIERGEERFLIEQDGEGRVFYDIVAYSQPRHWLVRLGRPYARYCQRCFGRDSKAAVLRAVEG